MTTRELLLVVVGLNSQLVDQRVQLGKRDSCGGAEAIEIGDQSTPARLVLDLLWKRAGRFRSAKTKRHSDRIRWWIGIHLRPLGGSRRLSPIISADQASRA